jgi:hypothetical protein
MDRHTEAVDIYYILKPVFFVSKGLGLWPYSAVGDIGNRRIIVTVSALIYCLGIIILNVGVFAYFKIPSMFTWENICSFSENILFFGTVCHALSAYLTCVLGCRQTGRQFERLNVLIGTTRYPIWRKDIRLLLSMQILCVSVTVPAAVLEISETISQYYNFRAALVCVLYYVAEIAGFMSEHQFVAFMHILKRTVQRWNNHIDDDFEIEIEMHFKQLKKLHASACDIAETVNAVYSPMLLLSVAKLFTTLTYISYNVVLRFIVHKGTSFCTFTGNDSYLIWLIIFTLRLIWLVYFTTFTAKEVSHNV